MVCLNHGSLYQMKIIDFRGSRYDPACVHASGTLKVIQNVIYAFPTQGRKS